MTENVVRPKKTPFILIAVVVVAAAFIAAFFGGFLGGKQGTQLSFFNINKCHASLPCEYVNQGGVQKCLYVQDHGGHKAGEPCP